jgi:hypothetical protein
MELAIGSLHQSDCFGAMPVVVALIGVELPNEG